MQGFEVIFIAPRSRRHRGRPVIDAIVALAKNQGITRMTKRIDASGTGASGHVHSAHFFELTDEPEELMFVLTGEEAEQLIRSVEDSGIHAFCVRRAIDYWSFPSSG